MTENLKFNLSINIKLDTLVTLNRVETPLTITSLNPSVSISEGLAVAGNLTANKPVTWAVEGADLSKVTLNTTSGVWSLETTNYEVKNVYNFTFRASDLDLNTVTQSVVINILDVDEVAPTITSSNPSGNYNEGFAISGTLTANEAVTWTKLGTDAARVTLNAATGAWSLEPTDYETKTSYSWSFRATDAVGLIATQTISIGILDVVEGTSPTITSSNPTGSFNEGVAVGGTLTANQAVTWSKTGTDASFVTLNTSTGVWTLATTDYETKTSYSFSFTATATVGGLTSTQNIAITILNVDEIAPTITSANPTGSYNEGVAVSGTLTANETVTWTKTGTDQASVTLNATTGVWSLAATDYETKTGYLWSFRATDTTGNFTDQVVSITVLNVDENAPVITSSNPTGSFNEGVSVSGTLTANETVTWSKGGTDAASVTLNSTTGVWSLATTDYETKTSYSFSFIATDTSSLTSQQNVTITILNVDEIAPTITSANPTGSFNEGVSVNGTLTANETVTWSKSGADQASVTLNATTGVWSLAATDYETKTSYAWTFTATDTAGNATSQNVTITVVNVDEIAPTITSANPSGTFAEGVAVGGTLTANETVTWAKSGTDASIVTLNTSTGVWSIPTTNYETKTSYSWTFTATDTTGNVSSQVVAITISDVDEIPTAFTFTDVTAATTATVYESNTITVAGMASGASAVVTVTSGEYSKNGGAYTTAPGTVVNGDTLKVKQTSSGSASVATNTTLTVGGVTDTFTVTTAASGSTAPVMLLVAGQSNSNAHGTQSYTPPSDIENLPNVFILNPTTSLLEAYNPGSNSGGGIPTAWGSEAYFAKAFTEEFPGRNLYIHKLGVGGTGPTPSDGPDWSPTATLGTMYFNDFEAGVNTIKTLVNNPAMEEVTIWVQGEHEMMTDGLSATYATHLGTMVSAWRSRIANDLFIFSRTRPIKTRWNDSWAVRKAQTDVAAADGNSVVLDCDDIPEADKARLWVELHPLPAWTNALGALCYAAWKTGAGNILDKNVPAPFSFPDYSNQAPGVAIESAVISLTNVQRPAAITVTGGEYRLLNPDDTVYVDWTSSPGFYHQHMKLQLRTPVTSPTTTYNVVITVGGVSETFTVATGAAGMFAHVSSSTRQIFATAGGTTAVTLPTGWQAGDYVVIAAIYGNGEAETTATAGWATLATANSSGTGNGSVKVTLFGRRMQVGDTAPSLTHAGQPTVIASAFRGVNATTPLATTLTAISASDTTAVWPAYSATAGQTAVYFVAAANDALTINFTSDPDLSSLIQLYQQNNLGQAGIAATVAMAFGSVPANASIGGSAGSTTVAARKVLATLVFNPT